MAKYIFFLIAAIAVLAIIPSIDGRHCIPNAEHALFSCPTDMTCVLLRNLKFVGKCSRGEEGHLCNEKVPCLVGTCQKDGKCPMISGDATTTTSTPSKKSSSY